ncbi:FAD-dependent oxidoreductase [Paenibacillus daejeonensis]|uniref:FAD-dependent oxidoreductase n=1 Tax=Paenibacillus daejeonensis TaxID=135193 RepID=UPI0003823677|nr:FAD-dependent oxidoreductase [Paenibacillus daejeonensis]
MDNPTGLPQFPESYWTASTEIPTFSALDRDLQTEVVVVGGGITGITAAYLLAREGVKVVLIDGGRLLNGTTAHTTAKVTAQHDLIYDELIRSEGEEQAKLFYQSQQEALDFVRATVEQENISCGWENHDAYVYTNTESQVSKLKDEYEAYVKLGIPGAYVDDIPLDVAAIGAVVMNHQAQFHPLEYLKGLLKDFTERGGQVFEETTASDLDHDETPTVFTASGNRIDAKYVIQATHFPYHDSLGFYFARMHAERSYVLGLKAKQPYPGGMYITAEEPKRSIRNARQADGSELIILGGQSHKTGQGICTINHYEELQMYAKNALELDEIAYRWSAQDLITGDKLPYIGRATASHDNIFVATGFRKWGMTNGTAAALLLTDLILDRANRYEELFSPSRGTSGKMLGSLIKDNADVAKHLIGGKLDFGSKRAEELSPDEGSVIRFNGKRAGAYRDEEGKLYLVDTTCTHMGCEVEWNNGERSWDCPCHGSRFSITGEVMEGPAEKPLKRLTP